MNDNSPSVPKNGSLVPAAASGPPTATAPAHKPAGKKRIPHPIPSSVSSYIQTLRGIALTGETVLPHTSKWIIAEKEKAEKRIAKFIPGFPDPAEETTLELKTVREYAEFREAARALNEVRSNRAVSVLARALFMQMFSEFDVFSGSLLKGIYLKNDSLLKGVAREISLCNLLDYNDLDSVKKAMLEKEIDSFRRDSYVEQFASLEKKFSLTLRKFKEWGEFVELSQRRNLFTHNDGIVSEQYLLVCDREGHRFDIRPSIGDSLPVSMDYFNRAIRLLSKVALMLGFTLWAKVFPKEEEELQESLNDILYANLEQKRWSFVAELHDFALSEPMMRGATEINLRIRTVNIAIALKFSERSPDTLTVLHSLDWSAAYRDFKLAIAVLEDKFDEAVVIMKSIGRSGEIIDQAAYHTWPLFMKFREYPAFYETYQSIYDESFAEQIRREVAENSVNAAPTQDGASTNGEIVNVIAEVIRKQQPARAKKRPQTQTAPKPGRKGKSAKSLKRPPAASTGTSNVMPPSVQTTEDPIQNMTKKSVQKLLKDIRLVSEQNYQIVEAVRALVKKTIERTSEEVKYGGILFTSGVQFGGVFAYKAHVRVEFGNGAKINDPFGFLEGTGKGRRHVKLMSVAQIKDKKLAQYLSLALQASKQNES